MPRSNVWRADGAQVTVNEDGTTTVSWLDQEVKPKENGASGWQKTIHIVAKESCPGGNNMTTNVNPNSFLSFGGTQLELPCPDRECENCVSDHRHRYDFPRGKSGKTMQMMRQCA